MSDLSRRQMFRAAAFGAVATIALEGDVNAAPNPELAVYAGKFKGRYEHRLITGGAVERCPIRVVSGHSLATQ